MSLLVGIVMEGMAIVGMDHAFNRVEHLSLFAFPGELSKLPVFGPALVVASPEMTQLELILRVKLDAAEAKTMVS